MLKHRVVTQNYALLRSFSQFFSNSPYRICTSKMASIRKQEAGTWHVRVRRKGRSISENFVRYEDAKRWAVDAERQIDRGETPTVSRVGKLKPSASSSTFISAT